MTASLIVLLMGWAMLVLGMWIFTKAAELLQQAQAFRIHAERDSEEAFETMKRVNVIHQQTLRARKEIGAVYRELQDRAHGADWEIPSHWLDDGEDN
jgi:biopolymer transport protein ExbB/TolQ